MQSQGHPQIRNIFSLSSIIIPSPALLLLLLLGTVSFLLSSCQDEQSVVPDTNTQGSLHEFAGAHARVVWLQDLLDNKDVSAHGKNLSLTGYDSEDGRGERAILAGPESFHRPLIAPSGEQIVFSNYQQRRVQVVDWSGENRHDLTKGIALAVWRDPVDGVEWIYVGRSPETSLDAGFKQLYRVRLQDPSIEELLWDKSPFGGALHVSGDGNFFSAEMSSCVLVDIKQQRAERYGKGCWPAVAPDLSRRFWFFDGAHRNLEMVDKAQETRNRIHLADAPGIDGHEVYHPRWSNHSRYMTMTGPYVIRHGGNNIRGGGGGVEVYVGRFNDDYSDIEAWFQVSHNDRADFYPDLWIADTEQTSPGKSSLVSPSKQQAVTEKDSHWPLVTEKLLFAWQNGAAQNEWTSPAGQLFQTEAVAKGMARFALNYQLQPGSGWYLANRSPAPDSGEYTAETFSLEFTVFLPVQQNQDNTILLTLGQENEDKAILMIENGFMILEERRAGQDTNVIRLGQLDPGYSHVMLDVKPATVTFQMNGEKPQTYPRTYSSVSIWPLIFGDSRIDTKVDGGVLLERIALYGKALGKQDKEQVVQLYAEQQKTAPSIKAITVRAELVSASSIPTPDDILPYRRGLVVNEYKIVEVLQGDIQDTEILVARWAILDGRRLADAEQKVGDVYELHLDVFDNRPELEGERLSMESDNLLLVMYYDLGS